VSLPNRALIKTLRELVDALVRAERRSNDEKEEIHDEVARRVAKLPRDGALEALDAAVRGSRPRRRHAYALLAELADAPGALDRIEAGLRCKDVEVRRWLVQTIGARRLVALAGLLNPLILRDPDLDVRGHALHATRALRAEVNLPALLAVARRCPAELRGPLLWALKDNGGAAARPFLRKAFAARGVPKEDRVVAAWGLARLGDQRARDHLVEMLDDPDVERAGGFSPGVSLRAAQALCDIMGWPFRWGGTAVKRTRERLAAAETTSPARRSRSRRGRG
jgi:hypothetical protein